MMKQVLLSLALAFLLAGPVLAHAYEYGSEDYDEEYDALEGYGYEEEDDMTARYASAYEEEDDEDDDIVPARHTRRQMSGYWMRSLQDSQISITQEEKDAWPENGKTKKRYNVIVKNNGGSPANVPSISCKNLKLGAPHDKWNINVEGETCTLPDWGKNIPPNGKFEFGYISFEKAEFSPSGGGGGSSSPPEATPKPAEGGKKPEEEGGKKPEEEGGKKPEGEGTPKPEGGAKPGGAKPEEGAKPGAAKPEEEGAKPGEGKPEGEGGKKPEEEPGKGGGKKPEEEGAKPGAEKPKEGGEGGAPPKGGAKPEGGPGGIKITGSGTVQIDPKTGQVKVEGQAAATGAKEGGAPGAKEGGAEGGEEDFYGEWDEEFDEADENDDEDDDNAEEWEVTYGAEWEFEE